MSDFVEMDIYLDQPSEKYREKIEDFKEEFIRSGDILYGTERLQDSDSFEQWLERVRKNRYQETVEEGKPPSYEFIAVRKSDGKIIGMINVRYNPKEEMYKYLGHIGYCIRISERKKGYASEMLRLALIEAKKLGLNEVLLTCDSDNIGSSATMKKNGAVLENEVPYQGKITQRYWIYL